MITKRRGGSRIAAVAATVSLTAFGLAACGSDPTTAAANGGSSGSSASGLSCPSGKLVAEGSTAQGNAISEVISGYGSECSDKASVEYNPTGSGAGIKSFYNGLADFAGSDSALKTVANAGVVEADKAKQRCGGSPALDLPMVVGPIAFAYNVSGLDKLVVNAQVLAEIFDGTITTWNDPKIAKLNPGANLPSAKIVVFFRSDESGTTENTTTFLSKAGNGAWTKPPGKAWTGVGEGKNKSSGVAEAVASTPNSISYVEWSYAKDNKLATAQLDSGSGATPLSAGSVSKALSEAFVKGIGNDLSLALKYSGTQAGAYPALLVTYEIACSKGLPADKTAIEKDFLNYFASEQTQSSLVDLGYAPLPSDLLGRVKTSIAAIS
jgi:phosphate transport system substrate-binding protein